MLEVNNPLECRFVDTSLKLLSNACIWEKNIRLLPLYNFLTGFEQNNEHCLMPGFLGEYALQNPVLGGRSPVK